MNIQFSPEIQQYIDQQVSAGAFHDPSELLSAAVKQMMAGETLYGWPIEELRAAVAIGAEQAERGELSSQTADEIFAEWEKDYSDHN